MKPGANPETHVPFPPGYVPKGLPLGLDGAFLIGRGLEQICFNENQISFHFDAAVGIIIEGGYSYQVAAVPVSGPTAFVPALHSNLMELLGQTISRVEVTSDGTLALFFANGHQLKCFDNPQYESYQIRNGDRVIIA
jgi:Family of unknown function (DUF6188)